MYCPGSGKLLSLKQVLAIEINCLLNLSVNGFIRSCPCCTKCRTENQETVMKIINSFSHLGIFVQEPFINSNR